MKIYQHENSHSAAISSFIRVTLFIHLLVEIKGSCTHRYSFSICLSSRACNNSCVKSYFYFLFGDRTSMYKFVRGTRSCVPPLLIKLVAYSHLWASSFYLLFVQLFLLFLFVDSVIQHRQRVNHVFLTALFMLRDCTPIVTKYIARVYLSKKKKKGGDKANLIGKSWNIIYCSLYFFSSFLRDMQEQM